MQENVMIDLETLGTKSDAVILSIGAATFDEAGVGQTTHIMLDLAAQNVLGRTIDPDTVVWWMQQTEEARKVFAETDRLAVYEALVNLNTFIDEHTVGFSKVKAWSNGADFDLVLLKTLYKQAHIAAPWRFFNSRCFRTLKELHPEDYKTAQAKIPRVMHHNAEDDARWQAAVAAFILKRKAAQAKIVDALATLADHEDQFPLPDGPEKDELTKAWWEYDHA